MSLVDLVPHRPPMLWLTEVVESTDAETTCLARTDEAHPLSDGEQIAGVVLAEWLAQCAAVHGGLERRRAGLPPCSGMVTGCREMRWPAEGFVVDARLEVFVRQVHGKGTGLAAFEGGVRFEGELIATGMVSVVRTED